jgi:hypothetical protein
MRTPATREPCTRRNAAALPYSRDDVEASVTTSRADPADRLAKKPLPVDLETSTVVMKDNNLTALPFANSGSTDIGAKAR